MSASLTPAQIEANRQLQILKAELSSYRVKYTLPKGGLPDRRYSSLPGDYIRSAEPHEYIGNGTAVWEVTEETINGDFVVDEALLTKIKDATIGPGNILPNANDIRGIINSAVGEHANTVVINAANKIKAGLANEIVLNKYMTLYNANAPGKSVRLMMRIRDLPVKFVKPTITSGQVKHLTKGQFRAAYTGNEGTASALAKKLHISSLGKWGSALNAAKLGGPVITLASTLVIDFVMNVDIDIKRRNVHFDFNNFLKSELENQAGNVFAIVLATGIGVALNLIGVPATVMLVIVFLGGIALQILWSTSSAPGRLSGAVGF